MSSESAASPLVRTEPVGSVLVATMDDGKANALSSDMLGALHGALDEAVADDAIGALVISSGQPRFCGGFDLGVIRGGDLEAATAMRTAGARFFHAAYGAPIPVLAACTGHAVAAGALMLLACDRRIGPDAPINISLPEVALGLPLPEWALALCDDRLDPRHRQSAVALGWVYDGPAAVDAGFLDRVVAPERVLDEAVAEAAALAEKLDLPTYGTIVGRHRASALARMEADVR